MKQKLLSALLASAFAGVATTASAGVIQASYKNFAAEAFGTDVSMVVPTVGYSLALPLTGTAGNPNSFTITYTLTSGQWDAADLPDATLVSVNNSDFVAGAAGVIDPADPKKLSFVFTLNNGVTFPTGSTIVLGTNGGNVAATDGKIKGVFATLQQPALPDNYCTPTTAEIGVSVRLTNAAGVEFDSNFNLAPLKNDTPILQSGVATKTTVTAGSALANGENSLVDVLVGSLGKYFTAVAAPGNDLTDLQLVQDSVSNPVRKINRVINLGSIVFSDRAALFDTDGATIYGVTTGFGGGGAADGIVSHNGLTAKITGQFVAGGGVTLNSAADCAAATDLAPSATSTTFNAARTEATVTLTAAQLAANSTVYACYTVPGTTVIPTAQFQLASGTLARLAASNELATPICPGTMYNLAANGVRVDVRNYIPAIVEGPSGGWKNVIRVINTDESQPSVDVYGTALLRDGTLGATAVIAAGMKPRETRYLFAADIDAALSAAANGATFGADDIAANARLRVTAASSSIRIQNYHYNPATGNFFETSSAQGDDGPDYAARRDVTNK